jgi:hypothetical protein
MPTTRPDGSPLTPDDREYWNQPYVYREFPKMLYRRPWSGLADRRRTRSCSPRAPRRRPMGRCWST